MVTRSILRPVLRPIPLPLSLLMDGRELLSPPVGFGYTPPFNIYSDGTTSFNFDSLYDAINPLDITDYYVSPSGNNTNSGLTPLLAVAAFSTIFQKAATAPTPWVRINAPGGDYQYGAAISTVAGYPKNVIFKPSGSIRLGRFYLGTGLAWTATVGTTYSASRSTVASVKDYSARDAFGDPIDYPLAASLITCQATPGTWFQSGATVYVNTGGAAPTDNIMVVVAATNAYFSGSTTTFIFDAGLGNTIEFIGGSGSRLGCLEFEASGPNQKLYLRNVWLRFGMTNGLSARGTGLTVIQGGGASGNGLDGLNYHSIEAYLPTAIEIGVYSYNNGYAGGGSNNASSMHDGGTAIRTSGVYDTSSGSVVIDVNDGTKSWNIKCLAKNSTLNDDSAIDASWCVFTGTAKMWLDRCTYGAGSSTSEYDLSVGAGCTMYLRGTLPGTNSVAGTLTTY